MRPKLSIIIPVYNEAKKIKKAFARLERFFSRKDYEMEYVFIEDGGDDGTLMILTAIKNANPNVKLLVNERNMGKGLSTRRGIFAAKGDYMLFIDVDMSTPLQAFTNFERYLKDYDIVIASRWTKESTIKRQQPWDRRVLGRVFYMIVNRFFLKDIRDTNCGFKCYKRDVAKDIFSLQGLNGWGFDVELLYIAQKKGYTIKEVPVVWAHYGDSRVNTLTAPFLTLAELLRIKINDWKGLYGK